MDKFSQYQALRWGRSSQTHEGVCYIKETHY